MNIDLVRPATPAARDLPTGFAVALGLCFILPLLNYFRDAPIADFYGEWASALVMAVGALFITRALPRRLEVSGVLLTVPITLALLIAVQAALGRHVYATVALLHLAYLGFFVLVALLGQHFRADGLAVDVARRMAWAIVLVGLVNAAAQVAQLGRWDVALQPWVVPLHGDWVCSLYGNTAQANQTSTIAWLALFGTLYLAHARRVPGWLAFALVAVFMLSSAATSSRMAWLFLALAAGGMLLARPRWAPSFAARALTAAALVAGFVVATVAIGALIGAVEPGCKTSVARLAEGREAGISARLTWLTQSAAVWAHYPLAGAGPGMFMGSVFSRFEADGPQPLDLYAHNIVAQLAAEYGAIGVASLLVVAGGCLLALWRHRRELGAADLLLVGWLGVLSIHSLLEYPLWYVHFLMFFGLALGLLLRPGWRLLPLRLPARSVVGVMSVAALTGCIAVFNDYRSLDRLMFLVLQKVNMNLASTPEITALLDDADAGVRIYRPHADHIHGFAMAMNRDDLAEKIAVTDRLQQLLPTVNSVARRATLAVLDDDLDTARTQIAKLRQFFPRRADEMIGQMRRMAEQRPEELGPLAKLLDEVDTTPDRLQ